MSYHIEKDFVVCSNELLPTIKTYCREGFYITVAFTARNYYVVVKDPRKGAGSNDYVTYRVSIDNKITYHYVDKNELQEVRRILHEASDKLNSQDAIKSIPQRIREKPIHIGEVYSLDQETVKKINEWKDKVISSAEMPKDIKPFVYLVYMPNVTVYPGVVTTETVPEPIVKRFQKDAEKCEEFRQKLKQIVPTLKEQKLTIPVAPPFTTKLYKVTASAETVNRCSNETIADYVKFYLEYKVSRLIIY
jgi:hypothetical protein